MTSEQRICQNCQQQFTIEPEDFSFYERIPVPPPTFCLKCRMQRRFAWRNERILFRNTCAATGKSIITGFHPRAGIAVYDRDYWWSDAWDALSFGMEYDFSAPFFAQFRALLEKVPMPAVFNARTTNTFYSNYAGEYKDGYMVSASWEGENVAYASRANSTKDSLDVLGVMRCERCYETVSSEKLFNCFFCQDSEHCSDSWLLYGCKNCTDCFGCTNLRNKSHYIFNEPYSKAEYDAKLKELAPWTRNGFAAAKARFEALKLAAIRKYAFITNCQNVTGDHLFNAADCVSCFDTFDNVKDCKYLINALDMNDSYDGYGVGAKAELLYEAFDSGVQGSRQCFVGTIYGGANIFYSLNCHGCNNLFGCIGLRNKEYCIFNRQYSKEEFQALRARIIRQMSELPYTDAKGRKYGFGEFFPVELSPFAYNETVAQEYFPLDPQAAGQKGFPWREPEKSSHAITHQPEDLPEIGDADDELLKAVIACEECGQAYRLIPQELQFLRRAGIPLPLHCPACRHRARFGQIVPPRLYHRTCMCAIQEGRAHGADACAKAFETPYAPDRPETVYCEACYQSEVV